ncbi:MAG: hypothetical protein KKA79_10755 [Nanoarchaeota archaeon]|nr:hypothetical protein [Nanoarchaeota archaeon]MCG2717425.1 hypothetical protein [Nanoarchaeota archaeon]
MKLPKSFTGDKDLKEKTEQLINEAKKIKKEPTIQKNENIFPIESIYTKIILEEKKAPEFLKKHAKFLNEYSMKDIIYVCNEFWKIIEDTYGDTIKFEDCEFYLKNSLFDQEPTIQLSGDDECKNDYHLHKDKKVTKVWAKGYLERPDLKKSIEVALYYSPNSPIDKNPNADRAVSLWVKPVKRETDPIFNKEEQDNFKKIHNALEDAGYYISIKNKE